MAQPVEPDSRSTNRSESPAGSLFRRLFTFWRDQDEDADAIGPELPKRAQPSIHIHQSSSTTGGSKELTIGTSELSQKSTATRSHLLSNSGELIVEEFRGFTLWSHPSAVADSTDRSKTSLRAPTLIALPPSRAHTIWTRKDSSSHAAPLPPIEQPPSQAFTLWSLSAILPTLVSRWERPAIISLPPSQAFTTWIRADSRASLAARWIPSPIELPPSRAFSTWTTEASRASFAARWAPGSIALPPSKAFTLWSHPSVLPALVSRWQRPDRISIPESKAFSTWTTPAALRSITKRWLSVPIQLPPSKAFTLWTHESVLPIMSSKWEPPGQIQIGDPKSHSVWTTPAAIEEMTSRWPAAPPPPSKAFTLWTHRSVLPVLSDRWKKKSLTPPISLPDPNPFCVWTSAAALRSLTRRWKLPPLDTTSMITFKNPRPFSIWTIPYLDQPEEPTIDKPATPDPTTSGEPIIRLGTSAAFTIWTNPPRTVPAAAAPESDSSPETDSAAEPIIRLGPSAAFSVWTSVDGLASAATRWIPSTSKSNIEPIPSTLSPPSDTPGTSNESKVEPFPDSKQSKTEPETNKQTISQTQKDMDAKNIELKEASAFSIWSSADQWKPNLIAARLISEDEEATEAVATTDSEAAKAVDPPNAESLVDTTESEELSDHGEPAMAGSAEGEGKSADWWRWAFILAVVAGLGIIATQMGAIGKEKTNAKKDHASKLAVAEDLDKEKNKTKGLTEDLTSTKENAAALAEEKTQLEQDMEKAMAAHKTEIEAKTGEISAATAKIGDMEKSLSSAEDAKKAADSQISDMQKSLSDMESANKTATEKITQLNSDMDAKTKELTEASATATALKTESEKLLGDLEAQKVAAAKLDTQTKELGAKLAATASDKQSVETELNASSAALKTANEKTAAMEKTIADLQKKIDELAAKAVPVPEPEPAPTLPNE